MARRERVASSGFGRFMASSAGRSLRGTVGMALMLAGLVVGGIGGVALLVFGGLLLAAGVFDFCIIAGLIDNVWSGQEVRARGHRGAPRPA
jgi:uncharacterized membrane protein